MKPHLNAPEYLWLFTLALPLFSLIYLSLRLFGKITPAPGSRLPSLKKRILASSALLLGFAAAIFGLADPHWPVRASDPVYKNVRIFFLLDVSRSMSAAKDIQPNRLLAAKKEIADFYESLGGLYEVALIPFAGEANTFYCPPSKNRHNFLSVLKDLNEDSVRAQGTDLTAALGGLKELAERKKIDKEAINLAILLSDGGKEDGFTINREELSQHLAALAKKEFKIYAFGVGGPEKTPLIITDSGGNFVDYWKDQNNAIMYSELDEEILQWIAERGSGKYANFSEKEKLKLELQNIVKENRILEEEKTKYEMEPLRPWFFATAALLIILAILPNKKW
jgi:hypothetical protein